MPSIDGSGGISQASLHGMNGERWRWAEAYSGSKPAVVAASPADRLAVRLQPTRLHVANHQRSELVTRGGMEGSRLSQRGLGPSCHVRLVATFVVVVIAPAVGFTIARKATPRVIGGEHVREHVIVRD